MTINNIYNSEKTWDTIGESFDKTRTKPWKQCIDFIQQLPKKYIVADMACGNGRHLIPCAQQCKKAIGLDISRNLLNIANKKINEQKIKNIALIHGNLVKIPLKNNSIDAALYIASLHNIKYRENRVNSLMEINRILKKEGTALISVWTRWQDKYRMQFFKKCFKRKGQTEFGDIDIYWRQHNLNIPRFYHLYSKKEFKKDLENANLQINSIYGVKIHSKQHPDNYFAMVSKG